MLPGLLCDARIFAAQRASFPHAIMVDGFGDLRSLSGMAEHVLATAPERFSLLGHSMGARVALEVVRQAPQRVERLALVSTGTHPVRQGESEKRHALLALGREQGIAALVDAWLPPMVAPSHRLPAILDPLRAMCIDVGLAGYEAQITALLDRPEVEAMLPTIGCPTLVAVGSEDAWSPPAQHRAIAAAIPQAHMIVIEGSGHMLPVEAPEAFNAALGDWLALPADIAATTPWEKTHDRH